MMRNSAKAGQRQFSVTSVNPSIKPSPHRTLSTAAIERQSDELATMIDEYGAQHRRPISDNHAEIIREWDLLDDPETKEREFHSSVITLDDVLQSNAAEK